MNMTYSLTYSTTTTVVMTLTQWTIFMTTLNDALATIIQKTQVAVESGVSFLSEQIPDVIQQLLMWKFAAAVIWALASLPLVIQLVPVVRWARKYHKKSYVQYDFPGHIFLVGASLFVAVWGSISVMYNSMEALKIYIAPKVWLIEYAASLVK